jgi:hydroxymethylbilane synthase
MASAGSTAVHSTAPPLLINELSESGKKLVDDRRARKHIVIGSRKSELALWQARHVHAELCAAHPAYTFEICTEATAGDHILDAHLATLAAQNPGLFTKELEVGLLAGIYDLAVHSLKDVPTTLPTGLELIGISEREDPRDVLILASRHAGTVHIGSMSALPAGWTIGTSSVRREALLKRLAPGVKVETVRGNLNTRLRKLDATAEQAAADGNPHYDALILAAAGIKRLGWWDRVSLECSADEWPYGVGQGALGIEARTGDALVRSMALSISDAAGALMCMAERVFLNKLQGGCQVPIGADSRVTFEPGLRGGLASATLSASGTVLSLDGGTQITAQATHSIDVPPGVISTIEKWTQIQAVAAVVGEQIAGRLISGGATAILGSLAIPRPITYGAAEARKD